MQTALKCKVCKKPYKRYNSQISTNGSSTCSYACYNKLKATRINKALKSTRAAGRPTGVPTADIDKLFSKVVRERDGRCLRCGTTQNLHASHVLPKGKYTRLRWELKNCKTLCMSCHLFWWHKAPLEAAAWFEATFPGRALVLRDMAMNATTKVDRAAVLKELTRIYNEKDWRPYGEE